MKRLFLAIATHEGLDETAPQILKKLKINADQRQLDIRWTPPGNYHVTLVFLGNTEENKIEEIEKITQEVAEKIPPFPLKISDVGAFPDEFSSRVLFFGVQNSKRLRFLQSELQEKISNHGYNLDSREYSPHLTIGRLRNPHKTRDMISPFVRKQIAKIQVTEIVLYESVGAVPFPTYKPLRSFPLTGLERELEGRGYGRSMRH
jgi:2'-5' RNA ligase